MTAASISNTCPEIVHRGCVCVYIYIQAIQAIQDLLLKSILPWGFTLFHMFIYCLLVNFPPATSVFLSTGSVNKSRPNLLNKWAFKLQQTGLACMGDRQSPLPLASSKETNTRGRGCAPLSLMSVLGEWPDLTPMCFQAAVRVMLLYWAVCVLVFVPAVFLSVCMLCFSGWVISLSSHKGK